MADEWVKQEGSGFWQPEKINDELVGKVLEVKQGAYGAQYVIGTEGGKSVITPSNKVLQSRMAKVEVGETVKIVYLGVEQPKTRGYKPTLLFDVFVKKAGATKPIGAYM